MKIEDRSLREALGRKIMEVSQVVAEGYANPVSDRFRTPTEQDSDRKCATAASNTGWLILQALGFDKDEIRTLADAYGQSPVPP